MPVTVTVAGKGNLTLTQTRVLSVTITTDHETVVVKSIITNVTVPK
jgi:hypothetical protein